MKQSEIYFQQYHAACQLSKPMKTLNALYARWQRQLKEEGKFYVMGKKVVSL